MPRNAIVGIAAGIAVTGGALSSIAFSSENGSFQNRLLLVFIWTAIAVVALRAKEWREVYAIWCVTYTVRAIVYLVAQRLGLRNESLSYRWANVNAVSLGIAIAVCQYYFRFLKTR